MLHKPQLLRRNLSIRDKRAVVGYQRFELAAEIAALDPVDHEAAETGPGCDAAAGVNIVEVVADVFPRLDQVVVRGTA